MKSDRVYPYDANMLYDMWVSYYIDKKNLADVSGSLGIGISTAQRWLKHLESTIMFGESNYRHEAGRRAFKNAAEAVKSLVRTTPSLTRFRKKYRLRASKATPQKIKVKFNTSASQMVTAAPLPEQDNITKIISALVIEISKQAGDKYKEEVTRLENELNQAKVQLESATDTNAKLMKQNVALEEEVDKLKNDHRPAASWLKMIKDNI